jgi:hypothetical protein
MALAGRGVVIIWNDIAPELREDFFEWHPRQHMPERLSIPGFLRGRRCIAVDADVEFLTMYELATTDVLVSDAYKHRLTHPTEWSSKVLPGFRNNVRGACHVLYSHGCAMGGFVLTIRFKASGDEPALVRSLIERVMPGLTDQPRVTGAHLVSNDPSLTGGNAGVQRGRLITLPDLVIVVETSTAEGAQSCSRSLLTDTALTASGAQPDIIRGVYQLEYTLQNVAGDSQR